MKNLNCPECSNIMKVYNSYIKCSCGLVIWTIFAGKHKIKDLMKNGTKKHYNN